MSNIIGQKARLVIYGIVTYLTITYRRRPLPPTTTTHHRRLLSPPIAVAYYCRLLPLPIAIPYKYTL